MDEYHFGVHRVTVTEPECYEVFVLCGCLAGIAPPLETALAWSRNHCRQEHDCAHRSAKASIAVRTYSSMTAKERLTDDTVFTWPHMLVRHGVVGLGTLALVLGLGIAFAAPLRGLANPNPNPNLTPEPAKAPWYVVGLQELLSRFDPLVAGLFVPAGASGKINVGSASNFVDGAAVYNGVGRFWIANAKGNLFALSQQCPRRRIVLDSGVLDQLPHCCW